MGSIYVYGVVGTAADQEVCGGVAGLDGTSPVGIVAQGGIGCVISAHRGQDPRAVSRETILRYLLRHQQVVEHVMQGRTVLPMKFGTTLESHEEVRALLAQARHDLGNALDLMLDKVEVEVAATWDINRVLQEVGQGEEVARAREAIAARGIPTMEDKVQLGQVVKACLDRRRDAYRERMLEYLRPLAIDMTPNALVSEEMVMNVAFLVERARQQEFDERVRALDSLFDNQVTFRVI
ncbi:MAG: GvpL/GvpF family gas vesicle protein, partial [Chloroflexota bacterium]|nr:GvpL/GvpF family gas vesicle protein [Chloroflexota bacterium]